MKFEYFSQRIDKSRLSFEYITQLFGKSLYAMYPIDTSSKRVKFFIIFLIVWNFREYDKNKLYI